MQLGRGRSNLRRNFRSNSIPLTSSFSAYGSECENEEGNSSTVDLIFAQIAFWTENEKFSLGVHMPPKSLDGKVARGVLLNRQPTISPPFPKGQTCISFTDSVCAFRFV